MTGKYLLGNSLPVDKMLYPRRVKKRVKSDGTRMRHRNLLTIWVEWHSVKG